MPRPVRRQRRAGAGGALARRRARDLRRAGHARMPRACSETATPLAPGARDGRRGGCARLARGAARRVRHRLPRPAVCGRDARGSDAPPRCARLARAGRIHLPGNARRTRAHPRCPPAGSRTGPGAQGQSGIISPGDSGRSRPREPEAQRGLSGHLRPDHQRPPGPGAAGGRHLRPGGDRNRRERRQGAAFLARRARRARAEGARGPAQRHGARLLRASRSTSRASRAAASWCGACARCPTSSSSSSSPT